MVATRNFIFFMFVFISSAFIVNAQEILQIAMLESDAKDLLTTAIDSKDPVSIQTAQESLLLTNGKYEQVIGKINVMEGPRGWGYQLVEKVGKNTVYTGYGAYANENTYTIVYDDSLTWDKVASSTSELNI